MPARAATTVPVVAAPPPSAIREIEGLIAALGASGCGFQRNGRWHPSKKAEQHLRRQYDYLRERDQVTTAGQFIALAATRSSLQRALSGHAGRGLGCLAAGPAA